MTSSANSELTRIQSYSRKNIHSRNNGVFHILLAPKLV